MNATYCTTPLPSGQRAIVVSIPIVKDGKPDVLKKVMGVTNSPCVRSEQIAMIKIRLEDVLCEQVNLTYKA